MARYLIESVKCDVSEGGFACGPVPGNVVAEIQVKDEDTGEEFFLSDAEVEGTINISKTAESTFDGQMELIDDEDFWDNVNNSMVVECGDYDEFYETYEHDDSDEARMYKLLIYLVRAGWDEMKDFISRTTGRYLDEITIPKSDAEEEYLGEDDDDGAAEAAEDKKPEEKE